MSYETITSAFGAQLLARQRELKADLDAAGTAGLTSLVKALVWSGVEKRDDIIARVEEITGKHVYATMDLVLDRGDHVHWYNFDWNYVPMVHEYESLVA